jgi:hypothetical protein
MAAEESKESGEHQVESQIDDLIREILNETGVSSESSRRGMATTAALFETAFGSTRTMSRDSIIERLLVAEALASELADALAPALAEQLAPRLMKAMEQFMTTETESKKPASSTTSTTRPGSQGSQGRKPDTK